MQRKYRRDYFQSIWLIKILNTDTLHMDLYSDYFLLIRGGGGGMVEHMHGVTLNTKITHKNNTINSLQKI